MDSLMKEMLNHLDIRTRKARGLGYRSVCLGSYIPWDVKMQVGKIKQDLGWEGDIVENVPSEFNYEKIECWMQE